MALRVAYIVANFSFVDLEEEVERASWGRRMVWLGLMGLEKPVEERKRFLRGFSYIADCAWGSYCLPEQLIVRQEQNYIQAQSPNIKLPLSHIPSRYKQWNKGMSYSRACLHFNCVLQSALIQLIMLLNNFCTIIRSHAQKMAKVSLQTPNLQMHPSLYRSLNHMTNFSFCSKFDQLKNSDKTFELLTNRLQAKVDYCEQLEKQLQSESASYGQRNKEQIRIQLAQLAPIRTAYQDIKSHQQSIKEIKDMMKETKDQAEKKLLQEELQASNEKLAEIREQLWNLLIPAAKYDHSTDIIMQFRPGAGGAQSSIFVKDISQMYEAFCSSQGWKCWTTASGKESGVSAGYKFLDMRVQGDGAHKVLKTEAGVHKVIRVPETEAKGRLHSSTISVVVMPVVPFSFQVDPKDIKYQFTRSSGPGGQAVNKIQSACRATHIPTGLQVFIQEERSQDMNKKRATDLLKQRLFEIEYKKSVEEEQSRRKSQVTTMDRSQKIRTYNYPQDRITDHRTGLTKFGIKAMMNGELLQEFYQAYNETVQQENIQAFIEQLYEQSGVPLPKK